MPIYNVDSGMEDGYSDEPEDDPLIAYPIDDEGADHEPILRAFNQGFKAAEEDIPISLNPYKPRSRQHEAWNDGYEGCLTQGDE